MRKLSMRNPDSSGTINGESQKRKTKPKYCFFGIPEVFYICRLYEVGEVVLLGAMPSWKRYTGSSAGAKRTQKRGR